MLATKFLGFLNESEIGDVVQLVTTLMSTSNDRVV
jgi:putative Ca2+/H+ antiporter (TMEM165/GDT1 family)